MRHGSTPIERLGAEPRPSNAPRLGLSPEPGSGLVGSKLIAIARAAEAVHRAESVRLLGADQRGVTEARP